MSSETQHGPTADRIPELERGIAQCERDIEWISDPHLRACRVSELNKFRAELSRLRNEQPELNARGEPMDAATIARGRRPADSDNAPLRNEQPKGVDAVVTTCPGCGKPVTSYWQSDNSGCESRPEYLLVADAVFHSDCWPKAGTSVGDWSGEENEWGRPPSPADDLGACYIKRTDNERVIVTVRGPHERRESKVVIPLHSWLAMVADYQQEQAPQEQTWLDRAKEQAPGIDRSEVEFFEELKRRNEQPKEGDAVLTQWRREPTCFYDGETRPVGNNADEWQVFLESWLDVRDGRVHGTSFVCVQIAEAIDAAEKRGCVFASVATSLATSPGPQDVRGDRRGDFRMTADNVVEVFTGQEWTRCPDLDFPPANPALAQSDAQPVGWQVRNKGSLAWYNWQYEGKPSIDPEFYEARPLYTVPPRPDASGLAEETGGFEPCERIGGGDILDCTWPQCSCTRRRKLLLVSARAADRSAT